MREREKGEEEVQGEWSSRICLFNSPLPLSKLAAVMLYALWEACSRGYTRVSNSLSGFLFCRKS